MKNYFYLLILPLAFAGCGKTAAPPVTERPLLKIHADPAAVTKTSHSCDENGGIILKWNKDDRFTVYDTENDSPGEVFRLVSGDGTATGIFEGIHPGGTKLKALYPVEHGGDSWSECELNVLGQIQNGNGGLTHLSDYDYLTAEVILPESGIGKITCIFRHEMVVMKFNITLPEADVPKSITLSSDTGNLPVSMNPGTGTVENGSGITLILRNIPETEKFTAYMMMFPTNLDNSRVWGNIVCEKNIYKFYVDVAVIGDYENGLLYYLDLPVSELKKPDHNGTLFGESMIFGNDIAEMGQPELKNIWKEVKINSGTKEDPFIINNAAKLRALIFYTNEGENMTDRYFKLTSDIHVTADNWTPIGISGDPSNVNTDFAFKGNFDGGGHTISGKLSGGSNSCFGFFGMTDNCTISNLHITADVSPAGALYTGGIYGYDVSGRSTVSNCVVTGSIINSAGTFTGGIGGNLAGSIRNCHMDGNIIVNYRSETFAGGIAGESQTIPESCIFTGKIITD